MISTIQDCQKNCVSPLSEEEKREKIKYATDRYKNIFEEKKRKKRMSEKLLSSKEEYQVKSLIR